jgi:hypothetical protein
MAVTREGPTRPTASARREPSHQQCRQLADFPQAYHDMTTHNVEDGTGGLDGSIRFIEDTAFRYLPNLVCLAHDDCA